MRGPQFQCDREHHDRKVRFDVERCPLIEWIADLTNMQTAKNSLYPRAPHLASAEAQDWLELSCPGRFDQIFDIRTKLLVFLSGYEQIFVVRKLRKKFEVLGSQQIAVLRKIVLSLDRMPQILASANFRRRFN